MAAIGKASPVAGREVAYRGGGLWSCWAQAPGVGEWWLMPVDAQARRTFARTRFGKSQGCLQVKVREMQPPLSQHLKPLPEDDWEQEELL